jgi:glycosyltransferase involved in cell wall biosynthesis
VVVDVRPMQEPERSPLTADYLDRLLRAFAREPLDGESFVLITRALRTDPSTVLAAAGLPIVDRRLLPPTSRIFRSAGLTLDSFLLRGAEIGAGASRNGRAGGGVFHTAGGAVPIGSRLPVVATLLDMAPWELPQTYATSPAARFGHRLRARVLHDAARVIVCSRATAESARRRLHLPPDRISIIPLAVDESFRHAAQQVDRGVEIRNELSLPPRYLVFAGRYDARKDVRTLFRALSIVRDRALSGTAASMSRRGTDATRRATPPFLVFAVDDSHPDEHELVADAIDRSGIDDLVRIVSPRDEGQRAAIVAGAEAFVYPCLSEATGLPVLEALSVGVPVITSRAGALPESVGSAGIVVEPQDPNRLAAAIEAMWSGGSLAEQLRRQARRRAEGVQRTWSDVARETREAYSAAADSAIGPVALG